MVLNIMIPLMEVLHELLQRPSFDSILTEMMFVLLSPIWLAFIVGVIIGWFWKPNWALTSLTTTTSLTRTSSSTTTVLKKQELNVLNNCSLPNWVAESTPSSSSSSSSSPSSLFAKSPLKGFGSAPCFKAFKVKPKPPGNEKWMLANGNITTTTLPAEVKDCSSSGLNAKQYNVVNEEDLRHLFLLVENKDGGPSWIHMMDRSTPTMSYQAWRRDPKDGPPQYRSRTIYEDATPELLRDFFWDDEFRATWDDMLAQSLTLEECPTNGTMIGVPNSSVPRCNKPRHVDLYYSSWFIRAVESKITGMLTACEVLLFHHEDMGIPWEITKLGVRQGMWGAVKKIEPGLRAYQKQRAAGAPLSRSASFAQINTKVNPELLKTLCGHEAIAETEVEGSPANQSGPNIPKLLIFGGAIVLACSLDRGLLTQTLIFGLGRRFNNMLRRP
ncbi:hypothetical protein ACFE04_010128 [Oxalis oulophora]